MFTAWTPIGYSPLYIISLRSEGLTLDLTFGEHIQLRAAVVLQRLFRTLYPTLPSQVPILYPWMKRSNYSIVSCSKTQVSWPGCELTSRRFNHQNLNSMLLTIRPLHPDTNKRLLLWFFKVFFYAIRLTHKAWRPLQSVGYNYFFQRPLPPTPRAETGLPLSQSIRM